MCVSYEIMLLRGILIIYIQILSVCVSVCLSSIGGKTAGPIMTKFGTHMRIDLGMVPPHPRGVEVGILVGSNNQNSGKCHELSRKSILFF